MTGQGDVAEPVVTVLPVEIDMANADKAREIIAASCAPGTALVVADLTSTTFCDSSGFRAIAVAGRELAAAGIELRLAVPPGNVLRVIRLLSFDTAFPVFPSVEAAVAGCVLARR